MPTLVCNYLWFFIIILGEFQCDSMVEQQHRKPFIDGLTELCASKVCAYRNGVQGAAAAAACMLDVVLIVTFRTPQYFFVHYGK